MHPLGHAIWGLIWEQHTVKKKNVTSVILYPIRQAIWGDVFKDTVEKSQTNVTSVIIQFEDSLKAHSGEVKQVQPMHYAEVEVEKPVGHVC